jgi:hypothetical protein
LTKFEIKHWERLKRRGRWQEQWSYFYWVEQVKRQHKLDKSGTGGTCIRLHVLRNTWQYRIRWGHVTDTFCLAPQDTRHNHDLRPQTRPTLYIACQEGRFPRLSVCLFVCLSGSLSVCAPWFTMCPRRHVVQWKSVFKCFKW